MKNIVVVDTETSGFAPHKGARVVELAAQEVEVTPRGLKRVGNPLVFLQRLPAELKFPGTEQAFAINGYNDVTGEWKDAPLAGSSAARGQWAAFSSLVSGKILCGQNVIKFDLPFLETELRAVGLPCGWDRRMVDTMSFAWLIALEHGMDKFGLEGVYDALQAPTLPPHRALHDVERCIRVLEENAGRYFGWTSSDTK